MIIVMYIINEDNRRMNKFNKSIRSIGINFESITFSTVLILTTKDDFLYIEIFLLIQLCLNRS